LGVRADNRSDFEKKGELYHKHLVGVSSPFNFQSIPQSSFPRYTQRNQGASSACTDFSSATVYEANTGIVASARPPYANRPNNPEEGAVPAVTAQLWMTPGSTTEALCPSDNLSEQEMNQKFVGMLGLTIQNYVVLDYQDINQLAEAIQTYKAICVDVDVAWDEWELQGGVPKYIPNAQIAGGHQMAAVLPILWESAPALVAQQSWGSNDPDSLPPLNPNSVSNVVFTQEFLAARCTGALAYIFRAATPSNPVVTLTRTKDDGKETEGTLSCTGFTCDTLERPWLNNQINVSCIPKGSYNCVWTFMPDLNEYHYEVQNVPGRSGIFIHEGNFVTDVEGCIMLGATFADINGDGQPDVTSSRVTLAKFEALFPNHENITLNIQ